jgi:hypothetical protein
MKKGYKGWLTKTEDHIWMVKWSDLHSFAHGTHWMYNELSSDSNSIKYIKDGEIRYKPLEEGLGVDFQIVLFNSAKLIFPEVDAFEKEQYIKEYVTNGNPLFTFDKVSTIRDGGTIVLIISPQSKLNPFYIHKDNWTLHSDYPTTDDNIVDDEPTKIYVMDRLEKHKKDVEFNLKQVKNIIEKIKL